MPPRTPSVLRSLRHPSNSPIGLFFCPSCSAWRFSWPLATPRTRARPQLHAFRAPAHLRHASSLASTTAINAPLDVPPRFQELHQALDGLGKAAAAANYVNISRLQLALRGLEGGDAVVRVAVLGIGGQKHARKMARLLLADPLGGEGAWEKRVERAEFEGRGLLLRFGMLPGWLFESGC
ncbi:uncharacterized protein BDZ99DRAFT_133273 [Mytilinidion resinicola]|uniref:Uncharacterized protein n=1 Tax=Mytilinidion resinicola TaxID=574789 RepID=A0A6A6Z598_9PEZI|nr:uncharacterized protein BDZ99DRAFT_133273 [Mytilinidion resinicola]KAF2816301.1 hypothetical protein BDZ99DRAFT_133273 [Mytilinidion resinicola]